MSFWWHCRSCDHLSSAQKVNEQRTNINFVWECGRDLFIWTIKIIPRASVSVCGHHNIHRYHRLQFTMCCWILCSALFSWNVCHNTHVRIIIVDLRRLMKGDIVSVEGIPVTLKEFCSQVAKLSQHYDINWTDFQSADTELTAVDIPTAIQVWSVNIIGI